MADDDDGGGGDVDFGTKIMVTAAAFGAAFVTRKALIFGWKKVTGHEPPGEQDPSVSWAEALGWAMVVGVGISAARMVATRAVTRKMRHPAATEVSE